MNYKDKYLKYKSKYLNYKKYLLSTKKIDNKQSGGMSDKTVLGILISSILSFLFVTVGFNTYRRKKIGENKRLELEAKLEELQKLQTKLKTKSEYSIISQELKKEIDYVINLVSIDFIKAQMEVHDVSKNFSFVYINGLIRENTESYNKLLQKIDKYLYNNKKEEQQELSGKISEPSFESQLQSPTKSPESPKSPKSLLESPPESPKSLLPEDESPESPESPPESPESPPESPESPEDELIPDLLESPESPRESLLLESPESPPESPLSKIIDQSPPESPKSPENKVYRFETYSNNDDTVFRFE